MLKGGVKKIKKDRLESRATRGRGDSLLPGMQESAVHGGHSNTCFILCSPF